MASPHADNLEIRFREFVSGREFPCVGAKAALARGRLATLVARSIASPADDPRICEALLTFASKYQADPRPYCSLAVIFADSGRYTEATFEAALWARLQALSDMDAELCQHYDARVSDNVESPLFSLSFGGEAFFVVGLHPGASRPARAFAAPVLVFNPHDQLQQLRASGQYEGLRDNIMKRDLAIAGSYNPMLARYGDVSAARQYSGRDVGDQWQCPFVARAPTDSDDA